MSTLAERIAALRAAGATEITVSRKGAVRGKFPPVVAVDPQQKAPQYIPVPYPVPQPAVYPYVYPWWSVEPPNTVRWEITCGGIGNTTGCNAPAFTFTQAEPADPNAPICIPTVWAVPQ